MIVLIGILLGIVLLLYAFSCWKMSHFKKLGVKHAPTFPFVGNIGATIIGRQHLLVGFKEIYDSNPNERFVGMYEFTNPIIILRDLELIKTIGIKQHDNFLNHRFNVDESIDKLFGRMLVILKGEKWRQMRSTLSPAFTSSKMKSMFSFFTECADNVALSLTKEMASKNVSHLDLDVTDLFMRYSNDVIASCAFGLQLNSIEDRDNHFYRFGKKATVINPTRMLKFIGYGCLPTLMKWFKVEMIDKKAGKYFRHLVLSNMKERNEKNIIRPDMIHLLMEAKKGTLNHKTKSFDNNDSFAIIGESHVGQLQHKKVWTDDDLVAQALIFFAAGFDTTSTALYFLVYELALNLDIQMKLQVEIDETFQENNGTFNYDELQKMKYLDMVVSETLRKWPPIIMTDRQSIGSFNLGKPRNTEFCKDVYLQPGHSVLVPIHAIHHDEKYWPNPGKFDPERFSAENKDKIVSMTYLPFGMGPRNCIGSRFSLIEMKVMTAKLFRKFDVTPGPRTEIPLILEPRTLNLRAVNGCWLRFSKRNV